MKHFIQRFVGSVFFWVTLSITIGPKKDCANMLPFVGTPNVSCTTVSQLLQPWWDQNW